MKLTRDTRFNCAKRLESTASIQHWMINFLNLFTIAAGVAVLVHDNGGGPITANSIGIFIIGLSVLEIIFSMQDGSQKMKDKARSAHQCGRDISHIYRRLFNQQIDLKEASEEYENVMSTYEGIHDRSDFMQTVWESKGVISPLPQCGWFEGVLWPKLLVLHPILPFLFGVVVIFAVSVLLS